MTYLLFFTSLLGEIISPFCLDEKVGEYNEDCLSFGDLLILDCGFATSAFTSVSIDSLTFFTYVVPTTLISGLTTSLRSVFTTYLTSVFTTGLIPVVKTTLTSAFTGSFLSSSPDSFRLPELRDGSLISFLIEA